jgi:predicted amidophosphoribosyltransferase
MRTLQIDNLMHAFVAWAREQKRQTTLCRSCDLAVGVTETICPRCGASDPVTVSMSAATAVFTIAGCFIIVALTIAY